MKMYPETGFCRSGYILISDMPLRVRMLQFVEQRFAEQKIYIDKGPYKVFNILKD